MLCDKVKPNKIKPLVSEQEFDNSKIIKINFSNVNRDKAASFIEKNYVSWFNEIDYSLKALDFNQLKIKLNDISKASKVNDFKDTLIGHLYIILCIDDNECIAFGKVIGDYEYFTTSEDKHQRKIEWISKKSLPIKDIFNSFDSAYTGTFVVVKESQKDTSLNRDFFTKTNDILRDNQEDVNYVLIIDEINRGNISQIFGELITLIEDSKRQNELESLQVILPYSKKQFSVPSNIYIIGTMNTADRSVEALDTALRRRFSFIEMMPNEKLIEPNDVDGIDLQKLLLKINDRLEVMLSKEHTIGHTYLLGIENVAGLKHAFNNKIIPLLKEYFYGDFGKISMVIGTDFVNQTKNGGNKSMFMPGYTDMIDEYADIKPWLFTDINGMKDEEFKVAVKNIYSY
jgi:5-methylcytosine-specific restriction protein B